MKNGYRSGRLWDVTQTTMVTTTYRNKLVDAMVSKIKHIINLAERRASTIGTKGTAHHSRTYWELKFFEQWYHDNFGESDCFQILETLFPNGLVVVLRNYDYYEIHDSNEFLYKELVKRHGSNQLVSSIIIIENNDSGGEDLTHLANKVSSNTEWQPLSPYLVGQDMIHQSQKIGDSNTYWCGHYAINISGGNTESNIRIGNMPLGIPIYEYGSEEISESIELFLVYSMLCAENAKILLKNPLEFEFVRDYYKHECEKRGLLDNSKWVDAQPFDEYGNLQCCLSFEKINANDFLRNSLDANSIQYCHISAKSESDVSIIDGVIHTTFRPFNTAWGKKWANMAQGDSSVCEYHDRTLKLAQTIQLLRDSKLQ
jgi:hypothetical protein